MLDWMIYIDFLRRSQELRQQREVGTSDEGNEISCFSLAFNLSCEVVYCLYYKLADCFCKGRKTVSIYKFTRLNICEAERVEAKNGDSCALIIFI